MTDPGRVGDPVMMAKSLPKGTAIIYRHFGKSDHLDEARKLREVTFEKGLQYLIGDDPELTAKIGADGVHFRRDRNPAERLLWRRRCPDWLITQAGLKSDLVYKGNYKGLDALFISSIFPSQSPSAGKPIGITKLRHITQKLDIPIIALGGIDNSTAPRLIGTGAAGLAAISGLAPKLLD